MATLEARAVTDLTQVEVDDVVNQQRLMRLALRAFGRDASFLPVRRVRAQEHSRLDPSRLSGRPRPAHQHPARQHQARQRPKLSEVVAGDHVIFSVDVQGVRPRKVLLHLQRRRRQVLRHQRVCAGRRMYDPWQVTLTNVQQSMDYYLTGGDAESLHYHLEVLPAPTVTSISSTSTSPHTPRCRAGSMSRGESSRRSRGRRSLSTPGPTCRPSPRPSTSLTKPPRRWTSLPIDPTMLTGKVQREQVRNVQDQFQDDR